MRHFQQAWFFVIVFGWFAASGAARGADHVADQLQPAALPGPPLALYATAQDVTRACDAGLAEAAGRLQRLESLAPDAHWLAQYDAFNAWIEDVSEPAIFIVNVHPDKAMRDASQDCGQRWQEFYSSLGQNQMLYLAARRVEAADAIDAETLKSAIESFEDTGVGLPPAQRERAKRLLDRISLLGQEFNRHLRDGNLKLVFAPEELDGVPEGVLHDAARTADGKLVLTLDEPVYVPVMEHAVRAATRERMWRAKVNEGGAENLKLLAEITQLRREYAGLFGFSSYADFTLRRRMAGNVAGVEHLLGQIKAAVEDGEKSDLAVLKAAKARHLGTDLAHTTLQRWDLAFYIERLKRERFNVDQEAFRPYFPPQESLKFVMRVAQKMFGVRYTPVNATLWYPDAQAWAVDDAATGRPLAGLLVDLYPREGKFGHAAVWPLRSGAQPGADGAAHPARAALVVNFDRRGLTLEELETLLHEFGHALHNNLAATRYTQNSGSNVKHDFVEAPSQMLEDWVYDPAVLAVFQEVCPSCKPVPPEMIAQALAARDFTKGLRTARQHLFASYDLALHGPQAVDPLVLWRQMEAATPLGHVEGTLFPAGFSHVATGYGAGYYGYLWSLVVAMDLRSAFAGRRLDPTIGARYRNLVLAQGGQKPPEQLLHDFLGRDTRPDAFFDDLKRATAVR